MKTPIDYDLISAALANISEHYYCSEEPLSSPESTRQYLILRAATLQNEIFGAIFLNSRNRPIATETLFTGTIDGAQVYPRVVAQRCFHYNASALILFHNHPSGDPEPSPDDLRLTENLKKILAPLDIRVLDHIIVGGDKTISLAERGHL